jgi:2-polyprenyl-3-methyl-5-hydroxy-6-metoxy-1,4-benzoquinol methylase
MESPKWKHKIITENANHSLGIDIDKKLINVLKDKGFNVLHCDATSEIYLQEKFDLVHIGDVIEHVNNPVALLSFAGRHLNDNGKIIVRTPNPYNFNYIHIQRKTGTALDNMEHVAYICPMQAHEIGLRANLNLNKYLVLYAKGLTFKGILHAGYYILKYFSFRHAFAELFAKPERYTTIYVYEFTKK